jgi:hypothetical protein
MIKIDIALVAAFVSLVVSVGGVVGFFFGVKFRIQQLEVTCDRLENQVIQAHAVALADHIRSDSIGRKRTQRSLRMIERSLVLLCIRSGIDVPELVE